MEEQLKEAIKANAKKAAEPTRNADEALKFSQAALNAAHALVAIKLNV